MTPVSELISVRHTDLYVEGTWRAASDGQRIDVQDPASGEVIATVASASVPDALAAVEAASNAFDAWAARPPRERAEMATRKIAPALAAGCTVVLKPASETPLSALAVADLLEQAGVPKGVVNVIPSKRSSEVVKAMLKDPRVRKLSFTGSTEVGRILLAQAAENVISCSMELGGNAPFVVLADADLEAALEGALVAKMRNTGQSCIAANRFYVERKVAEKFASMLARAMGDMRLGNGLDPDVKVGPVIN